MTLSVYCNYCFTVLLRKLLYRDSNLQYAFKRFNDSLTQGCSVCQMYIWRAMDSPLFLSVLSLINLQVLKETTGRQHWSTFQINDGESNHFPPHSLQSTGFTQAQIRIPTVRLPLLHLLPSSLGVLQWSLRCTSVTHQSGRFTQTVSQPRNATESRLNPCKLQAVNLALTIRAAKQHFEGQAHPLSSQCCISELHDLLLNLPQYNLPDS